MVKKKSPLKKKKKKLKIPSIRSVRCLSILLQSPPIKNCNFCVICKNAKIYVKLICYDVHQTATGFDYNYKHENCEILPLRCLP